MSEKEDIAPEHSHIEANAPLPSMWELDSNEFPISLSENSDSTFGLSDWDPALSPHSFIPLDTPLGDPFPQASTIQLVPVDRDIALPQLILESTEPKQKRLVYFLYLQ